jgi:integrase
MSHKNKKSIHMEMNEVLQEKLHKGVGTSKHARKVAGDTAADAIFSFNTYKAYKKHCAYFISWAREKYKCKTLAQARQHADEWLQTRIDSKLSAYTIQLERSALCKLYGDSAADYIKTPPRLRKNIVRSRRQAVRDAHFSEANHADFCEFARSTGLRRAELKALTGDKVLQENGEWYIIVNKMSKGRRPRKAPIIGNVAKIVSMMQAAGTGKVFEKIPNGADIHSYRAEYATQVYLNHARPLKSLPKEEIYCCRKDRKGVWFDRRAMGYASAALGHSQGRVSVVGEHYIRLPNNIS